jgi:DNA adenine methylase
VTKALQVHRQFGSKARAAPAIIQMIPPDVRIWGEIFAGTAAVTLCKRPHREEHLNDLNGDIVNLFRVLRDDRQRERLVDLVELTPWAEAEHAAAWAEPHTGDPVEDARRYLVKCWQSMGGAIRTSVGWLAVDGANTPRSVTWDMLPARIHVAARRLKRVNLHQRPAIVVLRRFAGFKNACLLVDPPYPVETLADSRARYPVDMTAEEHAELIAALLAVKCRIILTMNPGTAYDQLAEHGWTATQLPVKGLRNATKTELIWTNFEPTPPAPAFDFAPIEERP